MIDDGENCVFTCFEFPFDGKIKKRFHFYRFPSGERLPKFKVFLDIIHIICSIFV